MNVEIGAEAALFLEMEYIRGIFVAVLLCENPERSHEGGENPGQGGGPLH
jgi:hypothetical protein